MALTYNHDQHRQYLEFTDWLGGHWLTVFEGDTEFYSAVYWDLMTRIWKVGGPVRKTGALGFMTAVKSVQTAGRYIDTALERGLLVETDNPADGRSKLIDLTPDMRQRLDRFFDHAIDALRRTSHRVDVLGPSPELD